ncbi:MAG: ribosome maturation factor RimP [Deltaproteobacteria bacterium]|nr:ribosome maturation factor RimP [Deltaproteobacteria bacterium]
MPGGERMGIKHVSDIVMDLVEPIAVDRGLDLVDVEFQPHGRRSVLRLYLDRPGGIGLDDLAEVSREVSDVLDAHDVVPGQYTLECSSPGINRRLRKMQDFVRYCGKPVRVRTSTPIAGARTFAGLLVSADDDGIEIEDESRGRLSVPLRAIERANYEHDFRVELRDGRS